jgi:hypothetical protein
MPRRTALPASLMQMLSDQTEDEPSFPMKEAQADMLRQVVERVRSKVARPSLKLGDPVHYGPGIGPMKSNAKEALVFIFWRYLNLDTTEDDRRIAMATESDIYTFPTIDCLIAWFSGQEVQFHLSCSQLLLPGDE